MLAEAAAGSNRSLSCPSQQIGLAYGQRDPGAASGRVSSLPAENDIQQHAVEGVARAWLQRDPVAASEWISALPQGDARNGAIYHLVNTIRSADPGAALNWARSVTGDSEKRLYLLKRATDAWTNFAPAEAKSAIEGLDIAEGDRATLLRRLQY